MSKTKAKKSKSAAIMGIAVLTSAFLVANVALSNMKTVVAFGLGSYFSSSVNEDSEYTVEGNYVEGFEASVNITSEGSVLLKNDNNILPLADGQRVTLLGAGSYNYVLGGTGSAGGKDDEYTISMYDAFSEAGLDINDDVWSKLEYACGGARDTKSRYGSSELSYFISDKDAENGWTNYKRVHEFKNEVYTNNILNNLNSKYDDYAIVTISRSGAEGASPLMDYDGDGSTLTGTTYFELSQDEKDLLKLCKEKFDHTILLVNSSAAMELGFIESEEYGIDACLWIGHPGEAGLVGVGYVLTGIANPSGALVDTYAYDLTTNPTYYNNDDNRYANNNQTFYQYEEGIYVGYRYYETAAAEGYFDSDAFKALKFKGQDGSSQGDKSKMVSYSGYDEVVQFPFGYGMSYTTFKQEITKSDVSLAQGGTNSITVKVTNTGAVAGKEIVQLYMEAPYNQDSSLGIQGRGLEKAKVVLVGFAKTSELAAGASEEVTIEFKTDNLASFDNFGQGCYVLEKGTYHFNIQDNAHYWSQTSTDSNAVYGSVSAELGKTIIYKDGADGARDSDVNAAVNAMDDVTAGDGNMLDGYLSRSNFAGGMAEIMKHESNETPNENASEGVVNALATRGTDTYEYTFQTYRNGVKTTITETLYAHANNIAPWATVLPDGTKVSDLLAVNNNIQWGLTYYVVVDSADEVIMTKSKNDDGILDDFDLYASESDIPNEVLAQGSARQVLIKDMASVDGDDIKWDQIASCISLDEAIKIQGNYGWSTPAVDSVGKEGTTVQDGPGEPNNGNSDMLTWFPSATVIAATWNTELAYEEGRVYGQQAITANLGGAYAPAMNIHRSPFGGRNFEYYSEDGFISGHIGGNAVSGIQSTGTSVYIKHLALNDNDTNRGGVCTWANEQAIREIYMLTYEISCKEYKADGIMGSLNRIGMSWAHYGMYTTMLRTEWGWKGHLITDGDGGNGDCYNNPIFWLAGTQGSMLGSFTLSDNSNTSVHGSAYSNDYSQYLLHETAKHALFQFGNSAMVPGTYAWWWISIWVILDVAIIGGIAAIVACTWVVPAIKKKKSGADTMETADNTAEEV